MSRGIGIEIDRHIRMGTKEGCGALCRDRIFKRSANDSCLATSRHGYDQPGNAHQRRDCEGNGLFRYILNLLEPTFSRLLIAACLIQLDDLHIQRIVEVCDWRIVEGEMPILAN